MEEELGFFHGLAERKHSEVVSVPWSSPTGGVTTAFVSALRDDDVEEKEVLCMVESLSAEEHVSRRKAVAQAKHEIMIINDDQDSKVDATQIKSPQSRRRRWDEMCTSSPIIEGVSLTVTSTPTIGTSASSSSHQSELEVSGTANESLEKARAIAMRFQQEGTIIGDASIPDDIDYSQQRREHFEREKLRLGTYRLKNLEYVMKCEEVNLRQHVNVMDQMNQYEERLQIQKELQDRQRHEMRIQLEEKERRKETRGISNEAGGGIGTKEQRHAERVRVKAARPSFANPSVNNDDDTDVSSAQKVKDEQPIRTSLYLTNLSVDGSTTERLLHSLFRAYGRLDRVTMYRHRLTGELKGDGLIVFGRDAVEVHRSGQPQDDGRDLVGEVCLQMNGAELPCGTIIGVQPADVDYKTKSKNDDKNPSQRSLYLPFSGPFTNLPFEGINAAMVSQDHDTPKQSDKDDLDDFFASLEDEVEEGSREILSLK